MGYWTASDLAGFMPMPNLGVPLIGPSTNPVNLTRFATIIEEISAHVDAAIAAAGYSVPVASSSLPAFEYVRLVVTTGVRWRTLIDMGSASAGKYDGEWYNQELARIREGRVPLPGASKDTGEHGRVLPRWGGIASPMISASWLP